MTSHDLYLATPLLLLAAGVYLLQARPRPVRRWADLLARRRHARLLRRASLPFFLAAWLIVLLNLYRAMLPQFKGLTPWIFAAICLLSMIPVASPLIRRWRRSRSTG